MFERKVFPARTQGIQKRLGTGGQLVPLARNDAVAPHLEAEVLDQDREEPGIAQWSHGLVLYDRDGIHRAQDVRYDRKRLCLNDIGGHRKSSLYKQTHDPLTQHAARRR